MIKVKLFLEAEKNVSNDLKNAITLLQKAVQLEDNMMYAEPRDWPIPSRHFLGAVLIKAGKNAEASKLYKDDLKINPENGWALSGLWQSLMAQKKTKEAAPVKARLSKAFARADLSIKQSVF